MEVRRPPLGDSAATYDEVADEDESRAVAAAAIVSCMVGLFRHHELVSYISDGCCLC